MRPTMAREPSGGRGRPLFCARNKTARFEVIARPQWIVGGVVPGDGNEIVGASLAGPLESDAMLPLSHTHARLRCVADGPPVDVDLGEGHGVDADAAPFGGRGGGLVRLTRRSGRRVAKRAAPPPARRRPAARW